MSVTASRTTTSMPDDRPPATVGGATATDGTTRVDEGDDGLAGALDRVVAVEGLGAVGAVDGTVMPSVAEGLARAAVVNEAVAVGSSAEHPTTDARIAAITNAARPRWFVGGWAMAAPDAGARR